MATKAKEPVPTVPALEEMGIPVSVAIFHRPVQSYGEDGRVGHPENALYEAASRSIARRTAVMFYTPHGLLCKQKHGTLLVPLANLVFARVK